MLIGFDDRFDSLLRYHTGRRWPEADPLMVKAQVWQESRFRPQAESSCHAKGLLQLMPATDLAIDGKLDGFEIEGNLDNGICYLKEQFDRLDEIPNGVERLKFSLAAYNCGRQYINVALKLAATTENCMLIGHHPRDWKPGRWQTWETTRTFLQLDNCRVDGKLCDYQQVWHYVEEIMKRWAVYRSQLKVV